MTNVSNPIFSLPFLFSPIYIKISPLPCLFPLQTSNIEYKSFSFIKAIISLTDVVTTFGTKFDSFLLPFYPSFLLIHTPNLSFYLDLPSLYEKNKFSKY